MHDAMLYFHFLVQTLFTLNYYPLCMLPLPIRNLSVFRWMFYELRTIEFWTENPLQSFVAFFQTFRFFFIPFLFSLLFVFSIRHLSISHLSFSFLYPIR